MRLQRRLLVVFWWHLPTERGASMDIFPAEVAVACLAPGIRHAIRLLQSLDGLQGHSAATRDERVQGGSPAPAAERRLELLEELRRLPPKLVRLAQILRGYPVGTARGKYIAALLEGRSGSDLKQAARLSKRAMVGCRVWLKSVVPP